MHRRRVIAALLALLLLAGCEALPRPAIPSLVVSGGAIGAAAD